MDMNKTAVMTDTNSGITPDTAERYGIYLLKMPFVVDGEEHLEYADISYEEFFKNWMQERMFRHLSLRPAHL